MAGEEEGKSGTDPSTGHAGTHYALRIGHAVPNFAAWKAAFDRDPIGRRANGVRRYRVMRTMDNPPYVAIDLEFDSEEKARSFRAALQELWSDAVGSIIDRPEVRLAEIAEVRDYSNSSR